MTEIIPTLPWREMETAPRDGTIFVVWCRSWNKPTGEPRIQFAQWLDPFLTGGKLCAPWDPNNEPYADGWLSLEELNSLTASGMLTEGGDAKQAPGESLSSPVGNAETHNPDRRGRLDA